MKTFVPLAAAAMLALPLGTDLAHATEGGLGRPITGLQIQNFAGVVPPEPGLNLAFAYAYYEGSISATREVPIAGETSLGLTARANLLSLTGLYVWDTGPGAWNYASAVAVPWAWMDASVAVRVGNNSADLSDSSDGLFDMTFIPLMASRHFSETKHMSLALYVYAPTGHYEAGRLANPTVNNWTFSPSIGYTQLFGKGTVELSTLAAVDFYTENEDTDYQNGAVFRIDALAVKRFPSGWGLGAVGGWIQQLEDDSGETADRLNGFQGHSLALGPIVTYALKSGGTHVEFSARWLKEFNVKNRLEGEPLLITASIAF